MKFPAWLIAISVWINVCTGGKPGWTVCARLWNNRLNGGPLSTILVRLADRLCWFDPQHCRQAWLMRGR